MDKEREKQENKSLFTDLYTSEKGRSKPSWHSKWIDLRRGPQKMKGFLTSLWQKDWQVSEKKVMRRSWAIVQLTSNGGLQVEMA